MGLRLLLPHSLHFAPRVRLWQHYNNSCDAHHVTFYPSTNVHVLCMSNSFKEECSTLRFQMINVPTSYHCGNSDCECGDKCVILIAACSLTDGYIRAAANVSLVIVNVAPRNSVPAMSRSFCSNIENSNEFPAPKNQNFHIYLVLGATTSTTTTPPPPPPPPPISEFQVPGCLSSKKRHTHRTSHREIRISHSEGDCNPTDFLPRSFGLFWKAKACMCVRARES